MNKVLCIILFLFIVLNAFGQKIIYTSNRLYGSAEYHYNIIGKVNNNILVWQSNAKKHFASSVLAYNDNMQLVHTVNTNILQSSVVPQPVFFATANSFKVIYKYQDNAWLYYKVADFDYNGNLLSVQTLDSNKTGKDSLPQPACAYSILQSADKKSTCFLKIRYDESNHALILNCSFMDDKIINKDFAFSIDVNKELLTAINIDNDKNILLVFEEHGDSATNLKVVRKNYADNLMLVSNKTVRNTNGFRDMSLNIVQNSGGYIIYGELNDRSNLFVWQMDSKLNDLAGDTILNEQAAGRLLYISSGDRLMNTFAALNNNDTNVFRNEASSNDKAQNIRIPNYSNDPAYIVNYNNMSPDQIATQKNRMDELSRKSAFKEKDSYANILPGDGDQHSSESLLKNIELFGVDSSNSIVWSKRFANSSDNKTNTNLDNSGIVQCNKNLHIVYEVQIKNKPGFLNHIIISSGGAVTETHYTTWDMKYKYLLENSALIDGNTLIVPSVKGSYMRFAKITLE